MRAAWLLGLSIIVLIITTPTWAVRVNSLYKATVPVTTQTATERSLAVQQALTQVLIKVSGNDQILNNPKLKSRLGSAETLVQQFGYTAQPTGKVSAPYLLEVQFDPASVNQWLQEAGAANWGQNRPLIVAWVAYDSSGHPAELLANDSSNEITSLLKANAEQHGLPLILPIMDMTDINQATTQDVIGMVIPNLSNAAKRYASDAILAGHITQDSNGCTSQWKLVLGDNQWDWNLTGKTPADIIPALIANMTRTLATRFAVVTTDTIQQNLLLKVTGITHYPDFAQLTRYLNHLTPVASVEIIKITTDNDVILKVSLRSSRESFIQALSIGKKLVPVLNTNTTDTMVNYQWNP